MSALPPEKFIEIKDLADANSLPLAVVLQREEDVKVYRVESEETQKYFNSFPNPFLQFNYVELATKKFGKEISKKSFLNASVFPAHTGCDGSGNEFAIYRARFEENEDKKS
jgi:hypothetical protein